MTTSTAKQSPVVEEIPAEVSPNPSAGTSKGDFLASIRNKKPDGAKLLAEVKAKNQKQ